MSSALGGILVGIVTKSQGGVRKGFALIGGICLTVLFQMIVDQAHVTYKQILAALLVSVCMYVHLMFPFIADKAKEV